MTTHWKRLRRAGSIANLDTNLYVAAKSLSTPRDKVQASGRRRRRSCWSERPPSSPSHVLIRLYEHDLRLGELHQDFDQLRLLFPLDDDPP